MIDGVQLGRVSEGDPVHAVLAEAIGGGEGAKIADGIVLALKAIGADGTRVLSS